MSRSELTILAPSPVHTGCFPYSLDCINKTPPILLINQSSLIIDSYQPYWLVIKFPQFFLQNVCIATASITKPRNGDEWEMISTFNRSRQFLPVLIFSRLPTTWNILLNCCFHHHIFTLGASHWGGGHENSPLCPNCNTPPSQCRSRAHSDVREVGLSAR